MSYDMLSTERGESNALTDSYNYYTYEREQRLDMLLSSMSYDVNNDDRHNSNSSTEITPLNSSSIDSNHTQTAKIISIKQSIILMMACIYIHCALYGLAVSLGIIYVKLVEEFGAPRAEAALIQSVYMGTSLGGAVLFAKIFDRFNPGSYVIIASLIGTVAAVVGSFVQSIAVLIALLGGILGTVMSCNVLATFVTVARVFTTNRKFALAILTIGQTIGQIGTPFVTYALIVNYNWNGALLVLSGITALNCISCGLVIMFTITLTGQKNDHGDISRTVSIFKDPLLYFFVFSYFVLLLFGPVEQWFVADLAIMKGYTFAEGSRLLSVNGVAGFTGRFSGALLVKMFKNVRTEIYLISACFFWAVGHYVTYVATRYSILVLCTILRGLSAGVVVATLPVMQLELGGLADFAINVAVCDLIGGIGEILGGYIGGLTVEITGNYQVLFLLASLSALYSTGSYVVVYFVLSRRRQVGSFALYTML